ncbi:MAG: hypothetical protein IPP14_09125 [Planctomycetes bacterium]|nr:hypothetical protein [Planctomycetota bacterium]
MNHEVRFGDQGILFEAYPFPGASIYPGGLLPLAEILDIDPDDHPPSLRTRQGEVLFLPAACRQDLKHWMSVHGIAAYPHDMVHRRRAETFATSPKGELMEPEADTDDSPPPQPGNLPEEDE